MLTTQASNTDTQPDNEDTPKRPPGNSMGLAQAYQFRNLAAKEAVALHDLPCETLTDRLARAKALQSLNAVWTNSVDRIRIYKGKPLPGSLRPERKPTKKKPTRAIPQEQPDQAPQDNSGGS